MSGLTAAELAALHKSCFETPRPWSETEFAGLLTSKGVFLQCHETSGFILGRVIADEAELLTLAVAPKARRAGIGRSLLLSFENEAQGRGATQSFLEVSAENAAAQALYQGQSWRESGRRRAYYSAPNGEKIDALIMTKSLADL